MNSKLKTLLVAAGIVFAARLAHAVTYSYVPIGTSLPASSTGYHQVGTQEYFLVKGSTVAIFSSTGSYILGGSSGVAVPQGMSGEFIKSYVSGATSIAATGVYSDLTSVATTSAGDWVVDAAWQLAIGTGTVTGYEVCISTVTGNDSTMCNRGDTSLQVFPPNAVVDAMTFAGVHFLLTTTPSIYLKIAVTYSSGLPTWKGRINARRN